MEITDDEASQLARLGYLGREISELDPASVPLVISELVFRKMSGLCSHRLRVALSELGVDATDMSEAEARKSFRKITEEFFLSLDDRDSELY